MDESARADRADDGDVSRRTRLAAERTYLAWWRTGLAGLAVAVAAGEIVPGLSGAPRVPWVAISVAVALLGVFCIAYAERRRRLVDRALDQGDFAPLDRWATVLLTAGGAVVGVGVVIVVLLA